MSLNGFDFTLLFKILLTITLYLFPAQYYAFAQDENKLEFTVFSLNKSFSHLTKSKVRMIYKGKVRRLNKLNINLADLSDNSPHKANFYRLLLGKTLSQVNGYRASLAFSGKGNIPTIIPHDNIESVLRWLNENPNGIAYMPKSDIPGNVNILFELK